MHGSALGIQFSTTLLLGLILTVSRPAWAAPNRVSRSAFGEMLFFSALNSPNRRAWLEHLAQSGLSDLHAREARAYLTGYGQDLKPLTAMSWDSADAQLIMDGSSGQRIRLRFAADGKSEIIVRDEVISATASTSLEELMRKIRNGLKKKVSVLRFLGPLAMEAANAETEGVVEGFEAAVGYFVNTDVVIACLGGDTAARSNCPSWWNDDASMIRKNLGTGSDLLSFTCEGDRFLGLEFITGHKLEPWQKRPNANLQKPPVEIRRGIQLSYSGNKVAKVVTTNGGKPACVYSVDGDSLLSDPQPGLGRKEEVCFGMRMGAYASSPRVYPLKKGEPVKRYGEIPLPLSRGQSCCADKSCREEMHRWVRETERIMKEPMAVR